MPRVRSPELPSSLVWLNCNRPLSLKELRGRIVILDFWTYGCINCLHMLPVLKYLEQQYKDSLTIIGVHSAKFANEQAIENIQQAIVRYDIQHPVVVDSDFQVWQQYAVRAWPTLVVIDSRGYVIGSLTGEKSRDTLEQWLSPVIHAHQQNGTGNFQERDLALEHQHKPLITPLAFPSGVLADEDLNRLVIADSGHHRLIISTIAGEILHIIGTGEPGLTDGALATAQFFSPQGMALDRANSFIYVADTGNHAIRRIDLTAQTVETIAGTGSQSPYIHPHGGEGRSTALNSPWDVALIRNQLFIAMAGSHQIWELTLATNRVQTYAGTGAEGCFDGLAATAAFAQPSGITTNGQELWVADSESSSIRRVELGDRPHVQTLCGSGELFGFGDVDGVGLAARLQHCLGLEYTPTGLWVADTYNHKIKHINWQTGECQTVLGLGRSVVADGTPNAAQFSEPSGLSATWSHLYIADTNNHVIRQVDLATLTVITLTFPGLCSPHVCVPARG